MRIHLAIVFVDDQAKALDFYTRVLGFEPKEDVPLGESRWLTVVSPEQPDGTELLLEPDRHPAAKAYKEAFVADGIPSPSSPSTTCAPRPSACAGSGVAFTQEPMEIGPVVVAVFDDTCGNLIQIVERR